MTIDPLEAVIAWLRTSLTTVDGRVAGKHRYGGGWTESQTGVSVHLDGGTPDIHAAVAVMRIEVRVYADDQPKIVEVWRELIRLSRETRRFAVNTSLGTALIHYFLPETMLSLLYDDVLRMDLGEVFFECMVAEDAVSE